MRVFDPTSLAASLQKANASTEKPATPSKETMHVAKEFEQIFLRKMLAPLEKSAHDQTSGSGAASAGSDVYSSMVVNALAEAISSGGGVGLADVIARSMTLPGTPVSAVAKATNVQEATTPQAPATQSALPTSVPSISTSIVPPSTFGSLRPRR
jgi:Rod binding domain-containing protein